MTQALRRIAHMCVLVVFLSCAAQSFAHAKKHPPAKPINLNTATLSQLEELPGVGPVTAKAILDFRAKSGPFRRVDDLLAVHRISEKRLAKMRPSVTIGPVPQSVAKQGPKHPR